jgi:RND family efflux transporter MFP subunit
MRRILVLLVVSVVVCAAGLLTLMLLRHHRESKEAQARKEEAAKGPVVTVATVEVTAGRRDVTLPADVRAFNQATLYAKSLGYLQSISVDRGDRVKQDEVLGVIESPETDQQVIAAVSDLAVKERDVKRARNLAPRGVMTKQELDRAEGDYKVSLANLARVRALQGYQQLRAPFAGVVTQRYVDVGALVQTGVPIVDMADVGVLRVTVYVGQEVAPYLKLHTPATLTQEERPDVKIEAAVSRISAALDPKSRTMQCEIWIDNSHWNLYPGLYLRATLHVDVPPLPTVPSEAVFLREDKLYVAVIEGDHARFVTVQPGLDDGKTLQIQHGLKGGETVAINFPSDLPDGAKVRAQPKKVATSSAW